ncbi:unnamed protein product [Rotaria sp. Silwood2]|nr:unnamed protein product [Rotaria sp. Silwood2]
MFSILPIKFNTSLISKSSSQRFYQQFIMPNIHRVSSIYLSNVFIIDLILSSFQNIIIFTQLKTLIIDNINFESLKNFLEHLTSLSKLSFLMINSFDKNCDKSIVYYQIFRLPTLKFCILSLYDNDGSDPLPIAVDNFSSIEYLVIKNRVSLNELIVLLSYVPQLRRLSINCQYYFYNEQNENFSIVLDHLTHISIKLQDITFDHVEPFIMRFFKHLQVLHISTNNDNEYLNAKRWKAVILSYMPQLRIFDIQHKNFSFNHGINKITCQTLMNQFNTSFWTERKWFFTHQYNGFEHSSCSIFYSIQPYRRKFYTLSSRPNQCNCPIHIEHRLNSVRHVHIEKKSTMSNCSMYFPNATELTISDNLYNSGALIECPISRIIPLSQLTKIIIDYDVVRTSDIIKILHGAHNCYTLILNSLLTDELDLLSLSCSKTNQFMFNRNNIRNLIVKSWCTFEQVQLLVCLCPRLQHLTVSILQDDFRSAIKYLLRNNDNTRQLFSLNIKSSGDIWIEKLMNIILEERQLNEVSVEVIGYFQCYLWW